MLQVEDVHTYYGDSHILQGVSLQVNSGELVCLVGRNGAGKTTTIRSIIGFNKPRAGHVVFDGKDLTGLPPYKIAGSGIGLVPQGRRIFPDLNVQENLLFAHNKKRGSWDLNKVYRVFPRLKERQKNRGDQLSGGEQQMLAIARALLMNPSLILMDEPSEGLAPLIVREIGRIIKEVKDEGLSVLLVEQNLALGLSVADRCYVLNKGQIVYESSPDELRQNEQVKHQYLGV
ncbi:MAG TPA: ABC transporter ATP-binding protein [Chloroflexota bacterium]|jgi:branched-chain amino acid transport system ATP-binding protein